MLPSSMATPRFGTVVFSLTNTGTRRDLTRKSLSTLHQSLEEQLQGVNRKAKIPLRLEPLIQPPSASRATTTTSAEIIVRCNDRQNYIAQRAFSQAMADTLTPLEGARTPQYQVKANERSSVVWTVTARSQGSHRKTNHLPLDVVG